MPAPLSVVIPTLDSAAHLAPCLAALAEALTEGLIREVVFADGGSSDATAEIADAAGARLVAAPRGAGSRSVAARLAAGAQAARGEWLLFLPPGVVLQPGWVQAVRDHRRGGPGRAGYFRLRAAGEGPGPRVAAAWANLRARLTGAPGREQGLLVSRVLFDRAGGDGGALRGPLVPLAAEVRAVAVPEGAAAARSRDGPGGAVRVARL